MPFQRALARNKTQSASSRIWSCLPIPFLTTVTVTLSDLFTLYSSLFCVCVCVCVCARVRACVCIVWVINILLLTSFFMFSLSSKAKRTNFLHYIYIYIFRNMSLNCICSCGAQNDNGSTKADTAWLTASICGHERPAVFHFRLIFFRSTLVFLWEFQLNDWIRHCQLVHIDVCSSWLQFYLFAFAMSVFSLVLL